MWIFYYLCTVFIYYERMVTGLLSPDYIFESSWEVCNKVGGIYTVLSTRAKTLQEAFRDKIIFIGPDLAEANSLYFNEDKALFKEWRSQAAAEGLAVRVGRWNVPGQPVAVLVDFSVYYKDKNDIYTRLWELYGVDSLHAYGDYDEASMFSYGAAKVAAVCQPQAAAGGHAVHHPCHEYRPQHRRQQQASVRLLVRIQRRPNGRRA